MDQFGAETVFAATASHPAGRSHGLTCLIIAAENGQNDLVSFLLVNDRAEVDDDDNGVKVDGRDGRRQTALHHSAASGHANATRILLNAGADVNARDYLYTTPLHQAVKNSHVETTISLINAGADVNARDLSYTTPLHISAKTGRVVTTRILLDAGAQIDARNSEDRTPLHLSALKGHKNVTTILLGGGTKAGVGPDADVDARADIGAVADISARDYLFNTPLHLAVANGHSETARILLDAGADVNGDGDEANWTPLHLSADGDDAETISLLVGSGADIEARTADGETPLRIAIRGKRVKSAEELVKLGASVEKAKDYYADRWQSEFERRMNDADIGAAIARGNRS